MKKKLLSLILVIALGLSLSTVAMADVASKNVDLNAEAKALKSIDFSDTIVKTDATATPGVANTEGQSFHDVDFSIVGQIEDSDVGFDFSDVKEEIGALPVNCGLTIPVLPNAKTRPITRSTFNIDGKIAYNHQSSLTSANQTNFYLFTWRGQNTALFELKSTNPNYVAMLCLWNKSSGDLTTTNIYAFANQPSAVQLPPGDYAWYVFSNNASRGESYNLMFNGSLPYDTSSCFYVTDDYQYTFSLINGNLYRNMQVLDTSIEYFLEAMDKRNMYFWNVWDYKFIAAPRVASFEYDFTDLSTFKTKHDKFDKVIFLQVGPGTQWITMHNEGQEIYDTGVYFFFDERKNYNDNSDRETPRALDETDMSYGNHFMVYDIATNNFVTFFSNLSSEWGSQKWNPVIS